MTPKIIHHIIGLKQSELVKRCLKSWEALTYIGFEIFNWTDNSLADFIKKNYPFALQAFLSARNHAEAADLARYLVVHKYGGYYVDWDIQLFKNDAFIKMAESNLTGYLLIDTTNQTLASEHFSAPPQESYLLFLAKDIVHSYNRGERELMSTPNYSGPYRMKTAYRRFPKSKQVVIDVKKVFEYDYSEIRAAKTFGNNKIMTHYWTHSWIG